jgi:hypothetical protein
VVEKFEAVGFVSGIRQRGEDDFWGGEEACIALTGQFTADALAGITEFSHVEILFLLHEVEPSKIVTGTRHPRNNREWPAVGIFAPFSLSTGAGTGRIVSGAPSAGWSAWKALNSLSPSSTPSMEPRCSISNR